MKTGDSMVGGMLKPGSMGPLAQYFVKFLLAYARAGVPVAYVTVQNEPLNETTTYPGMLLPTTDEANFIAKYLGPALVKNQLSTKILAYDHNWDMPAYPQAIYSDPGAAKYVAGTAWHWYAGSPDAQTAVHDLYPQKGAYITEASGGAWQGSAADAFAAELQSLIIGGTRNWAQGVILWNLALDQANGPTNNGCTTCRGVVTIDQSTHAVTKNVDYYALGHASQFVQYGAYRIASNSYGSGQLQDVAFLNPDGSKVMIAYNAGSNATTFRVACGPSAFSYRLPAGAAATFVWRGQATGNPFYLGAVSPTQAQPGKTVTLYGSGFGDKQGSSAVRVGSRIAPAVSWSNGMIVARVPNRSPLGASRVTATVAQATSNPVPVTLAVQLDRGTWNASASSFYQNDAPSNVLDGDPGTRWSTGQAQAPGEWLAVDMRTRQRFNELILDSGQSTGDYARGYAVAVSNDGVHWSKPIAEGIGISPVEIIDFPTQNARLLRVTETRSAGSWWSVVELNVVLK